MRALTITNYLSVSSFLAKTKPQDATERTVAQKPVDPAMSNSDENNDVADPRRRPSEVPESPARPAYSPITSRENSLVADSRPQESSQIAAEIANDEADPDYEAEKDDNDEEEYDSFYPAKPKKMSTTAPSRKMISSKTKRAESADEGSLSPTSAPKTKKRRTLPPMPDYLFDMPNTSMPRASAGKKQPAKVQLSVATGLDPPTDITKPKTFEASQLDNLKKCRAAVIDHFLADIKAAGFNEGVYIFIFRLENLARLLATGSDDEDEDQEEWITISPSANAEYKKWISKVSGSITNDDMPRIQVVLVAEKAFGGEESLLNRKDKQLFKSISASAAPKKKEIAAEKSPKKTKKAEDQPDESDSSDYEDVRGLRRVALTASRRPLATTRRPLTTTGRSFATTRRPLTTTTTRAPFKKPEAQAEQADLSEDDDDDFVIPRRQAKATGVDGNDSLVFRKLKEVEAELKVVKAENNRLETDNRRLKIKAKLTADAAWGDKEESRDKLQKTELARRRLMIEVENLKSDKAQLQLANGELRLDLQARETALDAVTTAWEVAHPSEFEHDDDDDDNENDEI